MSQIKNSLRQSTSTIDKQTEKEMDAIMKTTSAAPIDFPAHAASNEAQKGHFYALGIGPGSPDLLTVRAVRMIQTADVIVAPRSEKTDDSLALETIRPYLLEGQQVVEHVYPMKRDTAATLACWGKMAQSVAQWCEQGRSVVQITLGDPMIYSTSAYLLEGLQDKLAQEKIHIVPGISAFQAAASRCGEILCLQEDRFLIMTATDLDEVAKAFDTAEAIALYKAGKQVGALKVLLKEKGLLASARFAFYVEQEGREVIWRDATALGDEQPGYMATVLIRIGRRGWRGGD